MVKDTCSVCFGIYKDDVDEDTGCILPGRDWIQCGEDDCGVWSHMKNVMEDLCVLSVNVISIIF